MEAVLVEAELEEVGKMLLKKSNITLLLLININKNAAAIFANDDLFS